MDSPRIPVSTSVSEKIGKFNQQVNDHLEKQRLNPFSGRFSRSPSPRPRGQDYGKPVAGSLTDIRGQKAKSHINREILDLCTCIHDVANYNKEQRKRDPDYEPDPDLDDDDSIIVTFGELFQIYTKINDKVVGLLIAAKKRGFVYFEKEILFQRRDDDVLIALVKPISEIRVSIRESLTPSPLPQGESSSRCTSPAPESSPKSRTPEKEINPAPEQIVEENEKTLKREKTPEVKPLKREKTPEVTPLKREKTPEVVRSTIEVTVTEPQTPEPLKNEEIPLEVPEPIAVGEPENQPETVPTEDSKASAVEGSLIGDGPGGDLETQPALEHLSEPAIVRPAECGDVVVLESEKKEESSCLLSEEPSRLNLLEGEDSSQIVVSSMEVADVEVAEILADEVAHEALAEVVEPETAEVVALQAMEEVAPQAVEEVAPQAMEEVAAQAVDEVAAQATEEVAAAQVAEEAAAAAQGVEEAAPEAAEVVAPEATQELAQVVGDAVPTEESHVVAETLILVEGAPEEAQPKDQVTIEAPSEEPAA